MFGARIRRFGSEEPVKLALEVLDRATWCVRSRCTQSEGIHLASSNNGIRAVVQASWREQGDQARWKSSNGRWRRCSKAERIACAFERDVPKCG